MFKPIRPVSHDQIETQKLADSQTVVKGDALKWSSGYLAVCASGSYQDCRYVAWENVTSTTDKPDIQVIPVEGVDFEADCSHVVSIVDRGTYADFATKATIDPDGSTYNDFYIKEIVGAAESATKVIGCFTRTIA